MGRTVPTFRQALNAEVASWAGFRRGLSPADQAAFDEAMDLARHRADAGSLAARPVVLDTVLVSIVTGLLARIRALEARVGQLERDANNANNTGGGALGP